MLVQEEKKFWKNLPKIVYNGTKISSYFPVKDKIDIMHCSDVVYYYESSAENIKDDYVGETKCRFGKRIKEHQGKGATKNLLLPKILRRKILIPHQCQNLAKNYNNRMKRKFAESFFVKDKRSNLNIQKDTYKLQLFK